MSQAIFRTVLKLFVTRNSNATGHCVFFYPGMTGMVLKGSQLKFQKSHTGVPGS